MFISLSVSVIVYVYPVEYNKLLGTDIKLWSFQCQWYWNIERVALVLIC